MMLTEGVVRDAEPREKTYKLFDTGGLFVMVNPDGSRWRRLECKYGEKERGISLGTYPLVSLKLARQKRDDAKRMLQDGLDPSHQRRVQRVSQTVTFELVAQEWLELQSRKLGSGHDCEGAVDSGEVCVPAAGGAADQPDQGAAFDLDTTNSSGFSSA
jgi:hypothetical protein